MSQKKAHEVDSWLARPDPAIRLVLVYGPDAGLVSERAARFAGTVAKDLADPFAVVKLAGSDVDGDAGRLIDEARTIPLFGGDRLIWVSGAPATKGFADAMQDLASRPPQDARILIEAGDLKKNAALRSVVEQAATGMALPCFADGRRDLDRLIDETLVSGGLAVEPAVRAHLHTILGGDRLATRGELEKLALYASGRSVVTMADVLALSGDASASSADDAIDMTLAGDLAGLDAALAKLRNNASASFMLLNGLLRQLQQIQQLRAIADRDGRSAGDVVSGARPPVFFARKALVEGAVQRFDGLALTRHLDAVQQAVLVTRRMPKLAEATIRATLTSIAIAARQARR